MSFPSQSKDDYRNLKGRARSSSFNHSVIRKQSDLNIRHIKRRPSFDSQRHQHQQQIQPKASDGFLSVSHHHGGASSIDESGSEENEEDDNSLCHPISTHTLETNKQFVGKVGFDPVYARIV
jgi:hypothetical protein